MKGVPAIAALFLVAVAFAARAPLGDVMEASDWTPGDFWAYAFNTTFQDSVYLNGTLRATVIAIRSEPIRGFPVDVFVVGTTGSGTLEGAFPTPFGDLPAQGTWNLTGEQKIASTSRKIVATLVDITGEGRVDILNAPFALHWINSTANVVAQDGWSYPVPLGHVGTVSLNSSWAEDLFFQVGSDPPVAYNATGTTEFDLVLSLETSTTVSVPAGTFEAFRIREEWPDGSVEVFLFAPGAGNNARTDTFNETGVRVSKTELLAFRYQAAEPRHSGTVLLALGIVLLPAVAGTVALIVWSLRRRRAREETFTPPSLREPPPSGGP